MPLTCKTCRRPNPPEALFCYYDGVPLDGQGRTAVSPGGQSFPFPFVFPSGRACHTFAALAQACLDEWTTARTLLRKGALKTFLEGMGRHDLGERARQGATFPDPDRGLDQFLAALPGQELAPARLVVEPPQIDLGVLKPGQNHAFPLRLANGGRRLLFGSVSCGDGLWLALGGPQAGREKNFKFLQEITLTIHVRGDQLRANQKPLEALLLLDSNGGSATVPVRVTVPVKPFPSGVLAGARSPRQAAEKARAQPREAAALFENGLVADWYRDNGWTYPVQGPTSSGLAVVQQFFEALGLTQPPPLQVTPWRLDLTGAAGEVLCTTLQVETPERRPIYVHGHTSQPWLRLDKIVLGGWVAAVPLLVEVPSQPGEQRSGLLILVGNGNQRFRIPVTVSAALAPHPSPPQSAFPTARPAPAPPRQPDVVEPRPAPAVAAQPWRLLHAAPVAVLTATVAILMLSDALLPDRRQPAGAETVAEEAVQLDPDPWLELWPHDGKKDDQFAKLKLLPPLEGTFGLRLTPAAGQRKGKKLMFDEWGRTNNVCLRIDGKETLLGEEPAKGAWQKPFLTSWSEEGKERQGLKAVWQSRDVPIHVTQLVNIVPGQIQREHGRLVRHQDACVIRYWIENRDKADHEVGLRFLLDTFIGERDGVPFIVSGRPDLCCTFLSFDDAGSVPDHILALENDDPGDPGTIVNVRLKVPGVGEAPDRVTLGAWPHWELPGQKAVAKGHRTGWKVPLVSMQEITAVKIPGGFRPADSAVTLYWTPSRLAPEQTRQVGFVYGLGRIADDAAPSELRVLGGGEYQADREFRIQALVRNPSVGETLTLEVPAGTVLVGGADRQPVTPPPPDAARPESTVTWTVRASAPGTRLLTVRSSTGAAQQVPVVIRANVGIFGN
jgi:hypothetical protein